MARTKSSNSKTALADGKTDAVDLAVKKTGGACPICGRPGLVKSRPFCSTRCADIDLGRWLKEGYRVPTEEPALGGDAGDDDSDLGPASGVWRFH